VSEGVEILISADDQASKVLGSVADNVDSKVKRIKEVGRGAKASTEFIGTLANQLGGTAFGQYASGLAQLTERIGNFSEVSKAGAGGALAFKAGLAGVALVVGYKIGEAVGNWWNDTAKWNAELDKANGALAATAAKVAEVQSLTQSIATQKAELIEDPKERRAELVKYHNQLTEQAASYKAELKEQEELLASQQTWFQQRFGISQEQKDADEADLAIYRKKLESVEKEREAIQGKLRLDVEELGVLKAQAAVKQQNASTIKNLTDEVALLKASASERAHIEALQKVGGNDNTSVLLKEKEALLSIAEAQQKVAEESRKAAAQRLADAEKIIAQSRKEIAVVEGPNKRNFDENEQPVSKADKEAMARLTAQKQAAEESRKQAMEELRTSSQLEAQQLAAVKKLKQEQAGLKQTDESAVKVEGLLREKEALLAKAEAQKQADADAKKSADEQMRATERLAELKKNELAKLEEQRILLTEGKQAAHAFALEQQGLDKATADKISSEKFKLDKSAEKIQDQSPQQAVQGRLLTRGTSDDIRKRQLDAALKAVEVLSRVETNTKNWKSTTELHFDVVGHN
jgi:hypothetical protein